VSDAWRPWEPCRENVERAEEELAGDGFLAQRLDVVLTNEYAFLTGLKPRTLIKP